MFKQKPSAHDVFTPRNPNLNFKTYAERHMLEARLKRALKGHKYIIIHGDSGNGKTWLYTKVINEEKIPFEVVNLAQMGTFGSLNSVLFQKLGKLGYKGQTQEIVEAEGGFKPAGVGVNYKHSFIYKDQPIGPLEALGLQMRAKYKKDKSIIVLDNFEQIIDEERFVKQVASLIVSADEGVVADTGIKFLIVGTPSNIMSLMSVATDAATISNRFSEIPEVARLELAESRFIMSQGFEKHLDFTFLIDRNELYKNVSFKTDGIAQEVQELCLKIAENAERNNGIVNKDVVNRAEKEWIEDSLSVQESAVLHHMNSLETKVGRKNQVIYCLGAMSSRDFKMIDVERAVRETFKVPETTKLNIPQILADFQKGGEPLLRRSAKSNHYVFSTPKTRMAIRTMLHVNDQGTVQTL